MQCISQPGHAEQTINKSRFIAFVEYCADELTVAQCLRRIAGAHQGASHLAYAYRVKTGDGIIQRFSDAGEPSGTAGKPILQFIEGRDLINICVGVIRYYGGINLGTGGLARAYGGTARLAIEAAGLEPFVEMCEVRLVLDYAQLDGFIRELGKVNGKILDKQFGERVAVLAALPVSEATAIQRRYGKG